MAPIASAIATVRCAIIGIHALTSRSHSNLSILFSVRSLKGLQKGTRVCWRGDAADGGVITERVGTVTITWDNQHVAIVHHGDMRDRANCSALPF